LIPFVFGIFLADFSISVIPELNSAWIHFEILLTAVLIFLHYSVKDYKSIFGVIVFAQLCLLGFILYHANNPLYDAQHFSIQEQNGSYVGVVNSVLDKNEKQEIRIRLELCKTGLDSFINCTGNSLLYCSVDSTKQLELGDRIRFDVNWKPIKSNPNPYAFDYSRYLFFQKIHHIGYLKPRDWKLVEKEGLPVLQQIASKYRSECFKTLEKWIPKKENLSIASAMVLGLRSDLAEELKNAFVETGAIHVLAVSGLHVGILSMIVLWILNFLPSRSLFFKVLRYILYLSVIWMFALITGAGPAVLRACLMFSLYFSAGIFSRSSASMNSLAAAAFLILLNNPYQLFYLGFQFSFLAITSILIFMPFAQSYYQNKHLFIRYFLNLIVLSCVAQILVAPLSISYFNQFAVYFFLSGIVAVPAAFLVLCSSVGILAFSPVFPDWSCSIFSKVLNWSLDILRESVLYIQNLPGAVLSELYLDSIQIIFLYGFVFSLIFFLFVSRRSLLIFCILSVFLNGYTFAKAYTAKSQLSCFVYDVRGESLIDFFLGNTLLEFKSESLSQSQIEYTAKRNRLAHRVGGMNQNNNMSTKNSASFFSNAPFFQMGDKTILLVSNQENLYSDYSLDLDYLILTNGTEVDMHMLLQSYFVRHVIIDSSYKTSKKREYTDILKLQEIAFTLTENKVIEIHG